MSLNVLKMSPLFLEQIKNIKDFSSLYSVKMIFKKYDSAWKQILSYLLKFLLKNM